MKITLKKAQAEAIGLKALAKFLGDKDAWGFRDERTIDLVRTKDGDLDHLEGLVAAAYTAGKQVHGLKAILADIATWRKAKTNAAGLKARTLRNFETLLTQYLLKVPNHWVFTKEDGQWLPYFVADVDYTPAQESRGDYTPARVEVDLFWEELGGRKQRTFRFLDADVRGLTVVQALAQKGYYVATPELLAGHQADVDRWNELHPQVGRQCLCTGTATDQEIDGNPKGDRDSWYYRQPHTYPMIRNEVPGRVVVDVFREQGGRVDEARYMKTYFWDQVRAGRPKEDEADDLDVDLTGGDSDVPKVPVHPDLVVFDLVRHLRLRVHCRQLTEYTYDPDMAGRLVLDADRKDLVKLLIEMRGGGFQDIVQGKGGGAVVLLAGPPGTGKTLTAEVYAEAEGRALYSVQCSQLGTDPDGLEDELLKVFTRGKRWNAVMLLDEADVYVHERGNDLQQNAIVGVFLRVLEYQDTVLFLTTNRPDDVDDAIASRCIARLNYTTPDSQAQARIWRVLADVAKVPLDDATIQVLVDENPHLSGRDVKNLMKLARLRPEGVTPATVAYVRQFQPTGRLPQRLRLTSDLMGG